MSTVQIYDHDSEHERLHKNKMMELEGWLKHLGSIERDMDRMLEIISCRGSEKTLLYQKLMDKKKENRAQLDALYRYKNEAGKILECEDQQCDQYYGKRHRDFRMLYRYNLEKYNRLKEDFFNVVSASQNMGHTLN
ncbi:MAG TPA: hypothetical protein ENH91_05265 [Leeuwenhoekiella sp.]|nr:hypothetical protein [Leeuwenhoekiella sp.]